MEGRKKMTDEARAKMRAAKLKNPVRYWLGKKRDPETTRKANLKKIGRKLTEEHKRKIGLASKGRPSWIKGKHHSESTRAKLKIARDKIVPIWTGTRAQYLAIHRWVYKKLGQPNHCEECGITEVPKDRKRFFTWANISQKYRKRINDWKRLCYRCHKQYDKKFIYKYIQYE